MDEKEDYWMMLQCVMCARKRGLNKQQIDWLMKKHVRTEYFLEAMEWVKKLTSSPDTLQRSG